MRRDRRPSATLRLDDVLGLAADVISAKRVPGVVGVGIDVVDLVQFEHNARVGGDRWLRKLFTDGELRYTAGRPERLGTRFAAKEAVVKALGTGFRAGVSPRAVEIVCALGGQPRVVLADAAVDAAAAIGVGDVLISLSRECDVAVAAAWAMSSE